MQTDSFSIWRIRFSKVILNLGSWGLAIVLATLAVWGDILITQARWPIIPYVVVPLAGFFVAFCSLGFISGYTTALLRDKPWLSFWWVILPSVPAVVTAIRLDITDPTIFQRVGLIMAAVLLGIGIARRSMLSTDRVVTSKLYRVITYFGHAFVALWLAFAALLYVSAPYLSYRFQ